MEDTSIEEYMLLQVKVPDLSVEKTLQFSKSSLIWEVKQQIIAALPKELDEGFNYGLFLPPSNCKAGKFMDEERILSEYPFGPTLNTIELKYKRKVYKELNLDHKHLKQINSKSNQKKFVEHVTSINFEKINKLISKGLDPNFHCQDSGETPLCILVKLAKSSKSIISMVNGGALIDYRSKDGSTPMHRAVTSNKYESVKTLLDLGGSPNYRDGKGLTPLYLSVLGHSEPNITQLLLHERAVIGCQDLQGWQEVHQCCRSGLVQHLEFLLFYQADCNAQNASGNTPLHVCAVNNQDGCARLLLFRGADREVLNYAGQTAYQVSIIAGNHELASIIQKHNTATSVPFTETPKYNPRRRASTAPILRTLSDCGSLQYDTLRRIESPLTGYMMKPSSPSLSDRSMPPFSSGSSVSETSTGSGGSNSISQEEEQLDSASTLAASIAGNEDVLSLSSGVGTSSNSGSGGSAATPTGREIMLLPGSTVVAIDSYTATEEGHITLAKGDVIEITGSTDSGLLEGTLRGQTGFIPRHLVQEVRFRTHKDITASGAPVKAAQPPAAAVSAVKEELMSPKETVKATKQPQHFATVSSKSGLNFVPGLPRLCVLHKGKKGFGFVLRGAKAASPLMEMIPSDKCPSLQYMDDVDPGGVADMAGILKGDFLLAINNEDVTKASHETVVNCIRISGDLVQLTVMTITAELAGPGNNKNLFLASRGGFSTLPRKQVAWSPRPPLQHPPPPPRRDPTTTLSVGRARAKSMVAGLATMEQLSNALREKDVNGFSQPKSQSEDALNKVDDSENGGNNFAKELDVIFRRNSGLTAGTFTKDISSTSSSPIVTIRNFSSVAQMKKHKKGSSLAQTQFNSTPDLQAPNYELKDDFVKDRDLPDLEPILGASNGFRAASSGLRGASSRRSVSQEDLKSLELDTPLTQINLKDGSNHQGYYTLPSKARRGGRGVQEMMMAGIQVSSSSQETYSRTLTRIRPVQANPMSPGAGPAPNHPPPPVPGQMVPVMNGNSPDYAKVEVKPTKPGVGGQPSSAGLPASSFKPSSNARLYEGEATYKATSPPESNKKRSPTRTHSLPPRPSKPLILKREEPLGGPGGPVETYAVNGINYTTYTTFRSPLTPDDNRAEDDSETPTNARTPDEDYDDTYRLPNATNGSNNGVSVPPHIPEPDYDISDVENGSFSGSDSSWRDGGSSRGGASGGAPDQDPMRSREPSTATLRRNQQQRQDRKKKKTVSFIMNQDIANIIHSSGTMTKKESILKDTKREAEPEGEAAGCWRPTRRSPTKTVNQPPKASQAKPKKSIIKGPVIPPHVEWEGGSLVAAEEWENNQQSSANLPPPWDIPMVVPAPLPQSAAVQAAWEKDLTPPPQPKLTSNSKIRIEVGNSNNNQNNATATGVHHGIPTTPTSNQQPPVLSKSHSFCSPTTIMPPAATTLTYNSSEMLNEPQAVAARNNNLNKSNNIMSSSVHQDKNRSPLLKQNSAAVITNHYNHNSNAILKKEQGLGRTGSVQDILESGTGSGGNSISQADLQRARSQLKSSRSLPDMVDEQDNSSSGVSSDQDPDNNSHQDPNEASNMNDHQSNGGEYVTQLLVGPPGISRSNSTSRGGSCTVGGVAQWREWAAEGASTREGDISSTNSEEDKPVLNRMRQTKDASTIAKSVELVSGGGVNSHLSGGGGVNSLKNRFASSTLGRKPASSSPNKNFSSQQAYSQIHKRNAEPVHIEWTHDTLPTKSSVPALGDHVNVQRPFSRAADDRMTRTPDDRMTQSYTLDRSTSRHRHESGHSRQSSGQGTRSINESLALIKHHVKDLKHSEGYEGVPPPPSSTTPTPQLPSLLSSAPNSLRSVGGGSEPSLPPLLAPPPGFSDSEHSGHSDNDSLVDLPPTMTSNGGGGFSRYGATRISRQPRQQQNVSSSTTNGGLRNGTKTAASGSFQNRTVLEWSEEDVCDWLGSMEMPEYAAGFKAGGITGSRLTTLDNRDWERLGVTKITHRLNIIKSMKKYMSKK